jgi:hypothetical protein
MADFQITAQPGDTFNSLAMQYTVGGSSYAPALAVAAGYSPDAYAPAVGVTFSLPSTFIKPAFLDAQGNPLSITVIGGALQSGAKPPLLPGAAVQPNWLLIIGGVLAFMLLMTSVKKPARKRARARSRFRK